MSQRSRIHRHYEPRVHPERESFDILDWASQDAQHARFAVLARLLREQAAHSAFEIRNSEFSAIRLLDAGCGLADLRVYLRQNGFSVDPGPAALHPEPGVRQPAFPVPLAYTGVDITPAILAEAHRRQPDANLLLADLFTEEPFPPQSVDVVFASGLFNLDLGNNVEFIRGGVPRLFSLASRLLAVNFLHVRTPHKYGHCHYTHPDDLLQEFGPLAARADVIADYLPNDFTLVLWR